MSAAEPVRRGAASDRPALDADGLPQDETVKRSRRRAMAERLARELAHPEPGREPGSWSEYVAATVMSVRYRSAVDAYGALDTAPSVMRLWGGSEQSGTVQGRGGTVLYVHGPDDPLWGEWSLVCVVDPWPGWVLVCLDDYDGHCLLIGDDDPDARQPLAELHGGLMQALAAGPPADPI